MAVRQKASLIDLAVAIRRCLAETNDNPKLFTRAADPDVIIEKARRARALSIDLLKTAEAYAVISCHSFERSEAISHLT